VLVVLAIAAMAAGGCSDRIRNLSQDDLLPLPEGLAVVGESGKDCGNGREYYCTYEFVVQSAESGGGDVMGAVADHLRERAWELEPLDGGILRACKDADATDCVAVEPFTAWDDVHDSSPEWTTPLGTVEATSAVVVTFIAWGSDGLLL
jgi:hypothetical protein